jgi:Spy/CpxP family protein refolding chaperone
MLRVDPVNMDLVRAKLEEIESQKVAMRLARVSAIEKAKALLSSEQRTKLSALVEQTR